MTDEQQMQHRAAQLRKPHGEDGIKTGEMMSVGNKHVIANTLELLNAQANDRILEIGMGNGFFVNQILLKHQSITYTGCDYSELMIAEAEKLNAAWILNGRAKFIFSEASALPFADNVFTKIFTVNTIYFWDDEPKVLNELKRVLQPNGKLIIGFRPKHQTEKYPFTKYGFNLFTKEEVAQLLAANGFVVADAIEFQEPDFDMNGTRMKMESVVISATKI